MTTIRGPHSHFKGPHIESLPLDEIPMGVPVAHRGGERKADRAHHGEFAKGNTLAARGGIASGTLPAIARALGMRKLPDNHDMLPYYRYAARWRTKTCKELAESVGGGVCAAGPSALVATAARQLAWSMYWGDKGNAADDVDLVLKASKLANDAKAAFVAAQTLCAQAAVARKALGNMNPARALIDVLKEDDGQ